MINQVLKKRRRSKEGKIVESRSYYFRVRFGTMSTDKWMSLETTDKQVATKKAREIFEVMQQEAAGLLPKKGLRDAATETLHKHLEDFLCDLKTKGRTKKHVDDNRSRISRLLDECGWKVLADIDADSFIKWRKDNHGVLAAKTLNEYLASMVGLLNWMEKVDRISTNPLRRVERVDGRGKLKRERRAYTEDELTRLIEVSGSRGIVYLFAACTGLRRGEIEQLTWGDVHLNNKAPFVLARASTTKNKKDECVSLAPELVEKLMTLMPGERLSSDPVFQEGVPTIKKLKKDLEQANIQYCDDKGRYADFHALRHTCATLMLKNGIPAAFAKKHMRHSDLKLTTNRYSDDTQFEMHEALRRLPRLSGERALIRAQISGAEGQNVAQADANDSGFRYEDKTVKTGLSRTVAQGVATNEMERVMGIEPTFRLVLRSLGEQCLTQNHLLN